MRLATCSRWARTKAHGAALQHLIYHGTGVGERDVGGDVREGVKLVWIGRRGEGRAGRLEAGEGREIGR